MNKLVPIGVAYATLMSGMLPSSHAASITKTDGASVVHADTDRLSDPAIGLRPHPLVLSIEAAVIRFDARGRFRVEHDPGLAAVDAFCGEGRPCTACDPYADHVTSAEQACDARTR